MGPPSGIRERFARALARAGLQLDGPQPWDPRILDERLFRRVLAQGSLGLGEAYVDGWWECPRLDELFCRALRADVDRALIGAWTDAWSLAKARLWNLQSRRRAGQVARRHYDLGNDLFFAMLDKRAIYSCGYWREAQNLDDAQEAKLRLVARKLGLEPGMRVLDLGCGWGGAACFLAERYGVDVVGVTVSEPQASFAREQCRGLPVTIELRDYRELEGRFDRAYSLGMFEHVGRRNYRVFFDAVRARLADDGLFLLHTIGSPVSNRSADRWIDRYVFPNSMLPSAGQITAASEGRFLVEDWHSFGADYDTTLLAWYRNFASAWPQLARRYGDGRFHRLWRYYLLGCAGSFRARRNQLWQVVLSPRGVPGGYRSFR